MKGWSGAGTIMCLEDNVVQSGQLSSKETRLDPG